MGIGVEWRGIAERERERERDSEREWEIKTLKKFSFVRYQVFEPSCSFGVYVLFIHITHYTSARSQ